MNPGLALGLIAATTSAFAAGAPAPHAESAAPCSAAWQDAIERQVRTGDGAGHGPDIGSAEWKSVVEFKLGLRGQPDIPSRTTTAWCQYIDRKVDLAGPSFPCDQVRTGSIEALICQDAGLSALDRQLSEVYGHARQKAASQKPPRLKAEQRGWIKGRDECWKSTDNHQCVRDAYRLRIAELQARYRLVPARGPVSFRCNGNPADEVVVTFFETDPASLIAERGDSVSLMYQQPTASGTHYQGRNEQLREHGGEVRITWGHGAPEMPCRKAP